MIVYALALVLAATCLPRAESFLVRTPMVGDYHSAPSFLLSSSTDGTVDGAGTSATATRPAAPPNVHRLRSLGDFLNYIDSAPKDSLAVVKFFANSCSLCKRIELKYKKISRFYQNAPIRFAEIEKMAHPDLFPTLGVETYPYIQIYRNGQCVAAHGCESDRVFEPMVNDTIQRELQMTTEDWDSFLTAFAGPIQASTEKVATLRAMQSALQ